MGFDLDQTLGDFSALYFPALFLSILPEMSEGLRSKIENAKNILANCLVYWEKKKVPLGLLRTGLMDILRPLQQAKEEGRVAAIAIYSNNENEPLLEIVSKMVDGLLGVKGFFCTLIHGTHPLRDEEQTGKRGGAIKTIDTLASIFQTTDCGGASDVPIENIYFLDDSPAHKSLIKALGERYILVSPYFHNPSLGLIMSCFQTAIRTSGLEKDEEYYDILSTFLVQAGLPRNMDLDFGKLVEIIRISHSEKFGAGYFQNDSVVILEKFGPILGLGGEAGSQPASVSSQPAGGAGATSSSQGGGRRHPRRRKTCRRRHRRRITRRRKN